MPRQLIVVLLFILSHACSGGGGTSVETDAPVLPDTTDTIAVDMLAPDTVEDASLPDWGQPDIGLDTLKDVQFDTEPACEPGTGCFMDRIYIRINILDKNSRMVDTGTVETK
jgi:hypothetical protein